jgi:hypothetical protein
LLHVSRFGSIEAGLHVERFSRLRGAAVGEVITNAPDGIIAIAQVALGIQGYLRRKLDGDTGIYPYFSNGIRNIFEAVSLVLGSVDDDDVRATAQHHFIKPRIFEVPSIGKVDPAALIVGAVTT